MLFGSSLLGLKLNGVGGAEGDDTAPQQSPKCAKMLSQLLSNQAESTSSTMKVLSSLLQDDGCSLSNGEQQVAAKMMGKLMQGKETILSRDFVRISLFLLSFAQIREKLRSTNSRS